MFFFFMNVYFSHGRIFLKFALFRKCDNDELIRFVSIHLSVCLIVLLLTGCLPICLCVCVCMIVCNICTYECL